MSDEGAQKVILIAEHRPDRRSWLWSVLEPLRQRGVILREAAHWAQELSSMQGPVESPLLVILSADSPGSIAEHARNAGSLGAGVLMLTERACGEAVETSPEALEPEGATVTPWPSSQEELLSLVRICLQLSAERLLRIRQEHQLLNELAERKIMEARLKYLVAHDELTGLANRRSLEKKLRRALFRCNSGVSCGALLYLDLDRFDLVNDLEGHGSGDRLLVEVVGLFHTKLDMEHVAARIGADEFCILVPAVDKRAAAGIAERLRSALDGFHFLPGRDTYRISVSIGIAMLDSCRQFHHPGELITRAHQACYVAKAHGRNRVHFYNEQDVDVYTRHRDVLWVPVLREALSESRFFLVFQPVVRLPDGAVTHYEVLLRLRGRDGEVHLPGEFIPVAERMGLIHAVDLWVVENAVECLAVLPEEQKDTGFNINLSAHAFHESSLYVLLKDKLKSCGVAASRITFEITETATVSSHQQTREMISRIRSLGCHFALDDFGAGFSSFDYLKKFPVDYVKIDGQFICNLLNDETDQVLVKAMIDIAHKLGKLTVAEFVENPEVLRLLQTLGVDYAQGYLLGRPQPKLLDSRWLPLNDPPWTTSASHSEHSC